MKASQWHGWMDLNLKVRFRTVENGERVWCCEINQNDIRQSGFGTCLEDAVSEAMRNYFSQLVIRSEHNRIETEVQDTNRSLRVMNS